MKRRKIRDTQFGALACERGGPMPARLARLEPVAAIELMSLGKLCARLEHRQRLFLLRGLTCLGRLIHSAARHDRRNRLRLVRLQRTFAAFHDKFTAHLRAETGIIFPLIRRLESGTVGKSYARRSLQTHTAHLAQQHFEADEAIAELRALARNGCAPGLHEQIVSFERNLHEQIYEENRFLFPRALALSRT